MSESQFNTRVNQQSESQERLNSQMIDEIQFADMRELLEDDFTDLLQTYFADSLQRIELMRTAQSDNNNADGFEAAHILKGASATLGAIQLEHLCGQLQQHCREQQIGKQTALIEKIAAALQNVQQEINHRLDL